MTVFTNKAAPGNVVRFAPKQHAISAKYVLDELTDVIGFKFGSLALHYAGYEKIGDILRTKPSDLLRVPHIGERKLDLICTYFTEHGVIYPAMPLPKAGISSPAFTLY